MAPGWRRGLSSSSCKNHCFSSVASTIAVPPLLTVKVLSQGLKPGFSSLILWSPAESRNVDGVLPMYLSSTVISAPSGADLISIVESAASMPFADCGAGATSCLPGAWAANLAGSSGMSVDVGGNLCSLWDSDVLPMHE